MSKDAQALWNAQTFNILEKRWARVLFCCTSF